MALHTLTQEGHLGWTCVECGQDNHVHVSHEEVQYSLLPGSRTERRTVRLPACPCGAQTFLKVDFNEKELLAPNMWIPWSGELEERLQLLQRLQIMSVLPEEFARAGYTKQVVIEELAQLAQMKAAGGAPTPSRAVAERHMQLVGHMEKHGKAIPSQ